MEPTGVAAIRAAAEQVLDPDALAYYQAVAGEQPAGGDSRDTAAWSALDILPRYLRGITDIDTSVRIGELTLPTPVTIAPTASHGLAHPDAERATASGAGTVGALYIFSTSATASAAEVGAAAGGPWWAQLYLLTDRARSRQYLDEVRTAGAGAIVFTVDYGGQIGWSRFRSTVQQRLVTEAGNYPDLGWHRLSGSIEQSLTPDDIGWVAENSRLPVWVKGILHPADAVAAIDAGAAGIVVSNHGRRQLDGVVSTARALPAVIDAVGGRVPVMVDGGIRSGSDVLRALALGACAVGVGRPALWALAAGGAYGVAEMLTLLTAELVTAMASAGVASIADIGADLLASG